MSSNFVDLFDVSRLVRLNRVIKTNISICRPFLIGTLLVVAILLLFLI